ncbi:MAG: dipeptidase PepE [Planctomycetes bacterium]|nr:dipeptidase PepE [Planctomycetota bacterium]
MTTAPAVRRVLLLSNSTQPERGYLDHAADAIVRHLRGAKQLLFVPYALHDRAGYAAKARERFAALGVKVESLHEAKDPVVAVGRAESLFIGGGNTFRLLDALQGQELLAPIRARVAAGMPYLGASAGSNVACLTIKTTNDMPIVQPRSFDALALLPFNLNPHYLDPDPGSKHMGETREQRLREFHEMNAPPVVGLREGGWLDVDGARMTLGGLGSVRLFRRGEPPQEFPIGSDLSFLLRAGS